MRTDTPTFLPFLVLIFVVTLSTAAIVPFMGYFIVEGLGRDPWEMGVYAALVTVISVGVNKKFSTYLDRGMSAFPLIGIAGGCFLIGSLSMVFTPNFWVLLSLGTLSFGVGNSATSTLFALGSQVAETSQLKQQTFNAYMRATTSTAWMLGPACSFVLADQVSNRAVFEIAAVIAVLWLVLWIYLVDPTAQISPTPTRSETPVQNRHLRYAVAACFFLSLGHSVTFAALPLFYVQELNLPTYAPGTAFSMKTFVEIFAILTTPYLISRFRLRALLIAVALFAGLVIQILANVSTFPQLLAAAALEGLYYGLYASLSLSFVQSFAVDRIAGATATYWNTLKISSFIAGPITGLIAQYYDFHLAIQLASLGAMASLVCLIAMPQSQTLTRTTK